MVNKHLRKCRFCGWERVYVGKYFFHCKNCGMKNLFGLNKVARGVKS